MARGRRALPQPGGAPLDRLQWLLQVLVLLALLATRIQAEWGPSFLLVPNRQGRQLKGFKRPLVRRSSSERQDEVPLIEALEEAAANIKAPFFFPGHKMGRSRFPMQFKQECPWRYDLPEIPELDNLFNPEGPIKEAEELAAEAFGAKKTWFLVNGSTAGVLAAILACVRLHQQRGSSSSSRGRASKVVLPLNVHKSAINALVLSGADPVFVAPVYDPQLDICHGVPIDGAGGLAEAIARHSEGEEELAAVVMVSPTYHGVMGDVRRAVELCRAAGVPLIVDEAHGAHLQFLPGGQGTDALSLGADLVVQSTHKTLSALSQAGMLHAGAGAGEELPSLVSSALQMVQSSSPNYLLLASLDAARRDVAAPGAQGRAALARAVELAGRARRAIEQETPFRVLGSREEEQGGLRGAFVGLDPLRLTVYGDPPINGYTLDEAMIEQHGVYAELPASRTLTFALGPGSLEQDVEALVAALAAINPPLLVSEEGELPTSFPPLDPQKGTQRTRLCSPREAHLTPSELLPTDSPAILGRASAEIVCPYPPGIPVLMPGEVVTADVLEYLWGVLQAGGSVTGCEDSSFQTLRVLKTTPPP